MIYSDPIVPGTAVTDANRDFTKLVTVPPGLEAGEHTAVAQGVAPDGSPRSMAPAKPWRRPPATQAAVPAACRSPAWRSR